MTRPVYRILAAVIGLIFLGAGIVKALNPSAFAVDIQNYRIPFIPWRWDVVLALYLPWVEILCGAALLLRIGTRGALAITAGLLATFIAAYASTRPRGLDIACGCFGHALHRGYWPTLIGDVILLAIVLRLLKVDLRPVSPVIKGGLTHDK